MKIRNQHGLTIKGVNLLSSKDIKWEDALVLAGHDNSSHLAIFDYL